MKPNWHQTEVNPAESQFLALGHRLVEEGVWVHNPRTGVRCKTVINATLTYDVGNQQFPIPTTRKAFYKMAIAELIGYLRGYNSAAQFRAIGATTWDANANDNEAWLNNPNRKGTDDLGRIYGVQGRDWRRPDGSSYDQLKKIVDHLSAGIDDRGEILTFWNPGEENLGCLRPCMHTHHFSLLGDDLYLTSYQRSMDFPLGGWGANGMQCYALLAIMAAITGKNPRTATHHVTNVHVYEPQYELLQEQLTREPFPAPVLRLPAELGLLSDVEEWLSPDDFTLSGYEHHGPIHYPFTV